MKYTKVVLTNRDKVKLEHLGFCSRSKKVKFNVKLNYIEITTK